VGDPLTPPAYPATVTGGYRMYRETVLEPDQTVNAVPQSELIRAVQLLYDASNPIQLTVHETRTSGAARRAKETWTPRDSFHAVSIGRFFLLAQGESRIRSPFERS
jgi:hypothetical protein